MFRTELSHIHATRKIQTSERLVSFGSCFAENIGQQLATYKFQIVHNPTGILFNPLSIYQQFTYTLNGERPDHESFLEHDGVYLNYEFHSQVHANSKNELEDRIDVLLTRLRSQLVQANHLILTFGTSWVHELKSNGKLVANCHKTSQSAFSKRLLSVKEIVDGFKSVKSILDGLNPDLHIILTVSPIRHTREGLANNNLSKSVLRLACHEIASTTNDADYFPAYELLVDDLRDYRFYEKDLIHPNELAKDYIWKKFGEAYFDDSTHHFCNEWESIRNDLNHKPFHPHSDSHQKFLKSVLSKLENLKDQVDVSDEIRKINEQMI